MRILVKRPSGADIVDRDRQGAPPAFPARSAPSAAACNKNVSRTLACARYYYYRPHAGPGTAWRSHTSRVHIARGRPPAPATSGRCLELGRSVGGHAPPGGSRQRSACGATLPCVASQCHCLAEVLLAVLGSPDINNMRRILRFTGWIGHRSHISAGFDADASVHRISMSSTRSGPEESMVFVNCDSHGRVSGRYKCSHHGDNQVREGRGRLRYAKLVQGRTTRTSRRHALRE